MARGHRYGVKHGKSSLSASEAAQIPIERYRVSLRIERNDQDLDYRPKGVPIRGPADVRLLLQDAATFDREVFYCLHLDTRHRLVSLEDVSKGSLNASIVHPREVYKAAILSSAHAILVAHNHPSGDPRPSGDDIEITQRLRRCGDLLGISLLDHVVIGAQGYYSMRESGDL